MEFTEVIRKRESVRDFEDRPVPENILKMVLEAARLAPSASNRQPWKFIVVRDALKRQELARSAGGQHHIAEAPVVIAAVALMPEYLMSNGVPSYPIDIGIAVDHMALAAADQGLGTCWIGTFDQQEVRKILGVPSAYRVVILLPLGFPRSGHGPKSRKSLNQIVCYETFKDDLDLTIPSGF